MPWAPLVVMLAYTPACFVMFPRPLITLFAVIAFGPVLGFVYSIIGILGAALATYFAGRALPPDTVRNIVGDRMNEMTEVLRRRGLLACFAMRIVPAAPFAVEGIAAGAVRIKLWHFSLGTVLGMAPGTLTTSVFGDQIQTALEDPSRINYWLIARRGRFLCRADPDRQALVREAAQARRLAAARGAWPRSDRPFAQRRRDKGRTAARPVRPATHRRQRPASSLRSESTSACACRADFLPDFFDAHRHGRASSWD